MLFVLPVLVLRRLVRHVDVVACGRHLREDTPGDCRFFAIGLALDHTDTARVLLACKNEYD